MTRPELVLQPEGPTIEQIGQWCQRLVDRYGDVAGAVDSTSRLENGGWPYEDAAPLAIRLAQLERHYAKIYSYKYPPMLSLSKAARVFEAMAGATP